MQDTALMARFKTNLRTLMLKKSVELDRQLSRSDIAAETGLSLPTISRWYKGDIDRIEPETASKLMKYFEVSFADLVEVVDD